MGKRRSTPGSWTDRSTFNSITQTPFLALQPHKYKSVKPDGVIEDDRGVRGLLKRGSGGSAVPARKTGGRKNPGAERCCPGADPLVPEAIP